MIFYFSKILKREMLSSHQLITKTNCNCYLFLFLDTGERKQTDHFVALIALIVENCSVST